MIVGARFRRAQRGTLLFNKKKKKRTHQYTHRMVSLLDQGETKDLKNIPSSINPSPNILMSL